MLVMCVADCVLSQVLLARPWHQAPILLNVAVVSMTIRVFEVQPHFRIILPQIQKLLTVKSSTLLLFYGLYHIFIFHSTFNECSGSKHQSSPRAWKWGERTGNLGHLKDSCFCSFTALSKLIERARNKCGFDFPNYLRTLFISSLPQVGRQFLEESKQETHLTER